MTETTETAGLGAQPSGETDARQAASAGGVIYRTGPDGLELVLVSRRSPLLYALPKGTPDPGESLETTALREVREETGIEVRIVQPLGEVRYSFTAGDGVRVDKVVTYYLMEPVGGSFDAHDHEFDEAGWYHIAEAERLLTHRNQLHILRRAADLVATMRA